MSAMVELNGGFPLGGLKEIVDLEGSPLAVRVTFRVEPSVKATVTDTDMFVPWIAVAVTGLRTNVKGRVTLMVRVPTSSIFEIAMEPLS